VVESNGPSRAFTIGGGALAVAGLAVAITIFGPDFQPANWIVTLVAGIAIAFVAANALPIRGLRMRRSGITAEAVFLDVPIAVPLIAMGGAVGIVACALALGLGFGVASLVRRNDLPTDLARHGVLRVLAVLCMLPLASELDTLRTLPLGQGSLVFAGLLGGASVVFALAISAPVSALAYHIAVRRVWERLLRDPRSYVVAVGNVAWATVGRDAMLSGHYSTAALMWGPVIVIALLLRTIDEQHAELHRLRLVRDAVQAMLGERDPLPQINAILATLRVPAYNETVSVLAATGSRTDNWRTVTTIGPILSSAGDELRKRILARLKFSGSPSTTLRDDYYIAYAFAAQLSDGEVHGAIVVHRRNDRPLTQEQIQQFTNAAAELSPLLRDMRTIAATQSAATIDGLTGLYNRATTMDRLQAMLDEVSIPEHGAVLLMDIDHFKTINDQLGHAAGDDVLRKIGEIIRNTVRGGDTAGRIGGEEFLIVMPGATRDVALNVGERLRLAVTLGGMRYATGDPVTASLGVSAAKIGDNPETLLARADRGLYEAKRQGRNRIVEDLESA
jgi:diguanylate cyclase (GGDEF)-like protein